MVKVYILKMNDLFYMNKRDCIYVVRLVSRGLRYTRLYYSLVGQDHIQCKDFF
jgi:hypothetical protein